MVGADEVTARADQGTVADGDDIGIQQGAVEVQNRHSLEVDVLSKHAPEVGFNKDVWIVAAHQPGQDLAALWIIGRQMVECVARRLDLGLKLDDFPIPAVIRAPAQGLFQLCHENSPSHSMISGRWAALSPCAS